MSHIQELKKFGVEENVYLKSLTTIKIGGLARFFIEVKDEQKLIQLLNFLQKEKIKYCLIGEGSNVVFSDDGYSGVVVKIGLDKLEIDNEKVSVGAGINLLNFINELNKNGLAGIEHMAGIPGTLGGAICGNAGAYGQETKDCLVRVRYFDPDNSVIKDITKSRARFGYRESIFKKHDDWIILGADFVFKRGSVKELQKTSRDTITLREKKYPKTLKCPGSFFKNIVLAKLSAKDRERLIQKISPGKIIHGKVPAGVLLEVVGAKGMEVGGIKVADYHANLIFNKDKGTAKDVKELAEILKKKVRDKFGVELEEEVVFI